jgi:hypothetical protein
MGPRTKLSRTKRRGGRGPSRARERGLVEIRLRGPTIAHWIQELSRRFGATVRLDLCRPYGARPARVMRLLDITAAPGHLTEIVRFLRRQGDGEPVSISRVAPHRLLARTVTPLPSLCLAVFEVGGACTSCPFLPSEGAAGRWSVVIPRASDVPALIRAYASPGEPSPTVERIGRYRTSFGFTPRQEVALEVAFSMGYFQHPRRSDLSQVARALGVSRSTAMEILRRSVMKLAAQRTHEVGRSLVQGIP